MDQLLSEVLKHEGAFASNRKSHHQEYVDYYQSHDLATIEEKVAFRFDLTRSAAALRAAFDTTFGRAGLYAAVKDNNDVVHAASNLFTLNCKLRLPTGAP